MTADPHRAVHEIILLLAGALVIGTLAGYYADGWIGAILGMAFATPFAFLLGLWRKKAFLRDAKEEVS